MERQYCQVGNCVSIPLCLGFVHKLRLQILGLFWPPFPWLKALLNKIYQIYLVTLTFHEPPSPIAVNVVCEWPLWWKPIGRFPPWHHWQSIQYVRFYQLLWLLLGKFVEAGSLWNVIKRKKYLSHPFFENIIIKKGNMDFDIVASQSSCTS